MRYSLELTAARYGLEVEAVRALLNTGLEKLFQARKHRPKAHLDNKMLAAWNGGVTLSEHSFHLPSPFLSTHSFFIDLLNFDLEMNKGRFGEST